MFEHLQQQLEWTNSKFRNEILLITSRGTDGGFLLHHFISYYLKQAFPVCLVTLAQTFAHYSQAGLKIGANLDRAKKNGFLHHIDLLARLSSSYLTKTGQSKDKIKSTGSEGLHCNLEKLFHEIRTQLDSLVKNPQHEKNNPDPALLVIDDLSMLLCWGFNENDVINFIHYIRVLCKQHNVLLVTLMPVIEDDHYTALLKHVEHMSECIIRVKDLPSGHSKDIHGHLQILKRGKEENDSQMQYKLSDKNLIIFPKGTSPAVL